MTRPKTWDREMYHGHPAEIVRVLRWMAATDLPAGCAGHTMDQLRCGLDVSQGMIIAMVRRGYLLRETRPQRMGNHAELGFYRLADYGRKTVAEIEATEATLAARARQVQGIGPSAEAPEDLAALLSKALADLDSLAKRVAELESQVRREVARHAGC
jgi:hypothetical protein